jgi:NADH-quinone oxidoreductase subunit M
MLGHGIVSSGLFLCVGVLYDRYHTRNILYYGGLVQTMPIVSTFFLIFTLANLGLPVMLNFVGEFLVLVGT